MRRPELSWPMPPAATPTSTHSSMCERLSVERNSHSRVTLTARARGIIYFLTHRALWKPFASRLLPTLSLSASVIAGMFFFTYLPQLAVLVFVNGPLAVFTTVLLILNESSTIVNMVSRNFLLQDALLDTFDGTLLSRNASGVVSEGRQLKSGRDPIDRLGKILKSPFSKFTPKALVRYIMYLPLNFIPGKSCQSQSLARYF